MSIKVKSFFRSAKLNVTTKSALKHFKDKYNMKEYKKVTFLHSRLTLQRELKTTKWHLQAS